MKVARRMSSDQSNDPLMSSSTFDTSVLGSASKDRVSFPLYDGHGNTVATLSRHNGGYQVANIKKYDVWGKVRSDSGTAGSGQILDPNTRYCGNLGHKFDSTSGLVYMRARYYEAETGRFISEDPARDGDNWFVYCKNSPVSYSDLTGKIGLMDMMNNGYNEIKFQVQQAAIMVGAKASAVASLMASLEKYAERYAEALGDDLEYVLQGDKAGRIWITGIDKMQSSFKIAIDVASEKIKSYGPTGTGKGLPGDVPHWFPPD